MICTVFIVYRYRRDRKLLLELRASGLANFEEGNLLGFNPALTLDAQGDLLPYNAIYEFPKEQLKLGKVIGDGAFGVVMDGIAKGIIAHENETKVAVKMVKRMADNEVCIGLRIDSACSGMTWP